MTRPIFLSAICAVFMALSQPGLAQTASVGFGGGNHNKSAAVEVAADSLEIDQATGRATLVGNVVIVQDTLRMTARQVFVDYSEAAGKRSISRMRAKGDVVIVSGSDSAEGQEAVYSLGSGEIIMTGDVLLLQGGSALSGDRLTVNLDTGRGRVTGRVRTTLQVAE